MVEPAPFLVPALPTRQWLDAEGAPIVYGERWGLDGPPEAAYSVTSNRERFAPLHQLLDALVEHLLAAFDATLEADALEPGDLRAQRVRPSSAGATAGIRFAWTDFPGVCARLGGDVDLAAPFCGCDACDESLAESARRFSGGVLDVVFASSDWMPRER